MRTARAAARFALLVPFTAAVCLFNFVLIPAGWISPSLSTGIRVACLRAWARGAARILGVRIRVEGSAPSPPFFLVTNHLGYADVVVLAATAPACFVGKVELAGWPVLGPLIASLGTILVDRQRSGALTRVLEKMCAAVRGGHGVTFFPEATSSSGVTVLPFHSSLFEAAARTGYPVSCAGIWYGTPPGEEPPGLSVCWWGDMTFLDHFWRFLHLPRVDACVRFDCVPRTGPDRKRLAREAEAAVRGVFRPVEEESAPCGRP